MQLQKTTAIILAAGKGTRMGGDLPKVLHEVNEKPLIVYLLDTLATLGILKPIVVVSDRQAIVRKALDKYPVQFVDQGEPKGTGHAIQSAQPAIDPAVKRVFLLYGDTPFLSAATLERVYHELDDPTVACALVTATKTDQTERFGRIIRQENDDLKEIVEYKNATSEQRAITEVNVGGYCARLPWLWEALAKVEPNPITGEYYLTDIVRIAIHSNQRVVPVMAAVNEAHGVDTPELLAHVKAVTQAKIS